MPKPILSIITAMDKNRLIGKNNGLPWHLPEDLAFFKKMTINKPIVMGRKTFESIGRALPERTNIIVSRNKQYKAEGCEVLKSIEDVLKFCTDDEEIMLIGGASLYEQCIPFADQMYITLIDDEFEGDAWFPTYQQSDWEIISKESHVAQKALFKYHFMKLKRIS